MKIISKQVEVFILFILCGTVLFVLYCVSMPGQSLSSGLPPLTQTESEAVLNLQQHVTQLADEIGERHYGVPKAYNQAADYIVEAFKSAGLTPYTEVFGKKSEFKNIIAEHYGSRLPDEILVIGAHYDTVWMSPGADDNASGVAVMLEIARQLKDINLARTVRFVAFANEEYPHFFTDDMGSLFHAKRAHERNEKIVGMISLEMLGYYSNEPNSQSYPSPFSWFYPNTANFVAFVSDFTSRNLTRQSIRIFREAKVFPAEGLTAPVALVPDVRRSDQAAFWRYKYPAFMVTDTAAYRNYAYHNVSDVPNTLDYAAMARITTGLIQVIQELTEMK